jgi:hypothetical protein
VFALIQACASTVLANAQAVPSQTDITTSLQKSSSPVALLYVSSAPNIGGYEINAYQVAANGALTNVPGSPFAENGFYMAVNRKWLFATDTVNVYSFSIAWNGALQQVSSMDAQQYNQYNAGGPVNLFFDRSGRTLYDEDIYGNQGSNNTYQFLDFDPTSGAVSYLGATGVASATWDTPLSFIGNNAFAYGATCYHWGQYIYGFGRNQDGSLTDLNLQPVIPSASAGSYCPYLAAADAGSDVAIALTPTLDGFVSGAAQIAVYTADAAGDLTTTSTSSNMPQVAVGTVTDLKASPSGKLLAVAGSTGVQVFHFNSANPITRFTQLMVKDQVDEVRWDNANHLYAISRLSGKLYVFNVTPTGVTLSPGSPYSIVMPQSLVVLSRK